MDQPRTSPLAGRMSTAGTKSPREGALGPYFIIYVYGSWVLPWAVSGWQARGDWIPGRALTV